VEVCLGLAADAGGAAWGRPFGLVVEGLDPLQPSPGGAKRERPEPSVVERWYKGYAVGGDGAPQRHRVCRRPASLFHTNS
jgi:hypothetical protein